MCGAKGNLLGPHVIVTYSIPGPQRLTASMFWDAQFKVQVTIERESNDKRINSTLEGRGAASAIGWMN